MEFCYITVQVLLLLCFVCCTRNSFENQNLVSVKNKENYLNEISSQKDVSDCDENEFWLEYGDTVPQLATERNLGSVLIPFEYQKKWGFLDKELKVVILPEYEYVNKIPYSNLYNCQMGSYSVICNSEGKELVNFSDACMMNDRYCISYESPYYILDYHTGKKSVFNCFLEGFCFDNNDLPLVIPVTTTSIECFYLNEDLITKTFDDVFFKRVYPFNYGVAVVVDMNWNTKVIDKLGNTIIDNLLYSDQEYSEGLLSVMLKDGRTGYIDTKGKLVIEVPFYVERTEPHQSFPFKEDVAVVQSPDKKNWTIIDRNGKVLGSCNDGWLGFCSCGLISVRNDETYGFCDKMGNLVIRSEFQEAAAWHPVQFNDGYVAMLYEGSEVLLDTKGNVYYSADIMAGNKEPAFSAWIRKLNYENY